jgi:hypothetical protein
MSADDVTAELLAQPLDRFTTARNARAKQLKAAGQGELAAEVARLKKPPVHLWGANQAARGNAGLLRKLRDAAAGVARAQTRGSRTPAELRAASEAFQQSLDALVKAGTMALQQDGHAATEEAERRMREIFRVAAMEDGEVWERLSKGALIDEPKQGDDVLSMFQAAVPVARKGGEAGASGGARQAAGARETAGQQDPHAARAAERTARLDAERAEQLELTARRLRAEADDATAQLKRAEERARAAEAEAAEARAVAKKSARALARRT